MVLVALIWNKFDVKMLSLEDQHKDLSLRNLSSVVSVASFELHPVSRNLNLVLVDVNSGRAWQCMRR